MKEIIPTELSRINPGDFPDQLHHHGITSEVPDQDLSGLTQHPDQMFEVFEMLDKLETAGQSVVVPERKCNHINNPAVLSLSAPALLLIHCSQDLYDAQPGVPLVLESHHGVLQDLEASAG